MNQTFATGEVHVVAKDLEDIRTLYDRGLFLQAYRLAEEIAPLHLWRGADARILAGRLAGNLGSSDLADWHFIHAWRQERRHPNALWYYAHSLMNSRGPLRAWQFLGQHDTSFQPTGAAGYSAEALRSHWYSLHGAVLARLRDFDAAEDWLRQADALGAEPWTCLEWAALYTFEDRHAEAEAAARKALELQPWYRPAVQWVAHFLVQQERDNEAIDLLSEAGRTIESGLVYNQLASLQIELRRYDAAAQSLDEFERLSPLMQKELKHWLAARRADVAYYRGEYAQALEQARQVPGKFHEQLVKRLEGRKGTEKRAVVPVGFVRQHHQTCVPATLASICRFWDMPGDHLELAESISYAGTPHHSERRWAREHGWLTKEFTVTWDATVALIDRGIPFTLTTSEVASSHLQAAIGYDELRRTLVIRDPGERHQVERDFDFIYERYRSTGPRGMALVPESKDGAERLRSLQLPDEGLHDQLHRLELALEKHRRDDAEQIAAAMMGAAPDHYLTIRAENVLASYDADVPALLAALQRLLRLFPGDLKCELAQASCLRQMGRRRERLELLKRLAEQKDTDPACWQFYAAELADDAREHPRALYLLRRALRFNPMLASAYETLARIRWNQRQFDEALELYHFAVCLEDKDEFLARNYFQAARARGKTQEVLRLLEKRLARFGARSSQPARTLYWAYVQLERLDEAFAVLDKALKQRPGDGDLLIYAAEARMYQGDFARAGELLEKARGVSQPGSRLRSLAVLAGHRGDPALARQCWQEILDIEPLAEDAHRALAQLIAESQGHQAAVQYLEGVCGRFPHHFGLNRLWLDWIRPDGAEAAAKVIARLLEIHPEDAWVRREQALNLADRGRLEKAFREADEAARLEPNAATLYTVRAYLLRKAGRFEEARLALQEALKLSVDFELAIHELVSLCDNMQQRRAALAFVEDELVKQVTFGEGLLAFRDAAQATIPAEELLASLRRGLEARPDLWQTWTAVIRQLIAMERGPEALKLAQQAAARFPLLPALFLELASAQRLCKDPAGEVESLRRAVQLSPGWNIALRQLAETHERYGAFQEARAVYEQAVRRAPLLALAHHDLAGFLWRHGEQEQALAEMRQAVQLDPGLEAAWNKLCEWLTSKHRIGEVIDLAREWTKRKPGEARSWIRLGQALQRLGRQEGLEAENLRLSELLSAYDQATKLNPAAKEIYDLKAEALTYAGRYEEARAACNPPFWQGKPPLDLRARAAWVAFMAGAHEQAQKQMQAVLAEDENYYWAWLQLADWALNAGRFEDYLQAADHLVRLAPGAPQALAYRGEARLRLRQREAGMEDLRQAFRIDPGFAMAGFILFDEQMADKNLVGAEATLQVLEQNVGGDFVLARRVHLEAQRGAQEEALAAFKALGRAPAASIIPLDAAVRQLEQVGWKEPLQQALRELLGESVWHAHVALLFAERWDPNRAADLDERIAALDKALVRQPGSVRLLDFKAELLCAGGQFEQARTVCETPVLAQDQFMLRGRQAWVAQRAGRMDEALATMLDIVKENPNYLWGWNRLTDWFEELGRWDEALASVAHMVRLAPQDAVSFGHRGFIQQRLGNIEAAKADYAQALALSPAYLFGAWQLFDLHVQARDWDRAEEILEAARPYAEPAEYDLRKVDLAVYQNHRQAFPAAFQELCLHSSGNPILLTHSVNFLMQSNWHGPAAEVLGAELDAGSHVCEQWIRVRMASWTGTLADEIRGISSERPARAHCAAAYAFELGQAGKGTALSAWLAENQALLGRDVEHWWRVVQALDVVQDGAQLLDWYANWRKLSGVRPAMLLPLVRALRGRGRIDEAREVGVHALSKLSADGSAGCHKVWLMFDEALAGRTAPVSKYLESDDLGGLDAYHQTILTFTRALHVSTSQPSEGFAKARLVLAEAAATSGPVRRDAALIAGYRSCLRTLARTSLGAQLWSTYRRVIHLLPPPA